MKKYEKEVLQAQLDNEKAVLGKLEQTYQDALDEINGKIAMLLGRQDADLPHVIYQVQYQQMLKTQVQAILEQLQVNEFETVSDYLTHSYEEGFLGTMYSLHSQGVPFIFPINQERVAAAIQHETKLTSPLYAEMGHDIKDLSKKIAGEISRGISTGKMYSEIARDISGYARIPMNRAMTITRTEAHRIQTRAAMDACEDAKASGADVVKQWDATLDGNTRPSHRRCDGEIRELDEKFSNGLMYPGEPGGRAGEVINCRCALLQRARWALNRTETKYLGNMDNMTDEELQPLADKLHMPVDELRTYQGQIVPINAKSYDDFKVQYSKLSNYAGSQAEADAEARIAGYSRQVRSNAQKINPVATSNGQARAYDSIKEINQAANESLLNSYDERRTHWDLNLVSADDLRNSPINPITADYNGISVESANAFNQTITSLSDEYYCGFTKIVVGEKEDFFGSSTFATVVHQDLVGQRTLTINPLKVANYDKMTGRITELSQRGYAVSILPGKEGEYVATHEFAHSFMCMQGSTKNYINMDEKIFRQARKEIGNIFSEYTAEVLNLEGQIKELDMQFIMGSADIDDEWRANYNNLKETLTSIKISQYSMENTDEFMAEAFTQTMIGTNQSPYADRVMEIIDANFKK